jgi:hypothetical protein
MASLKLLNGLSHDVAQHVQSSLSYVHPHLAEECRRVGLRRATVDLLAEQPYPSELAPSVPLSSALFALKNWFDGLLQRKWLHATDVHVVRVICEFRHGRLEDDYDPIVSCTIVTRNGRKHVHRLESVKELPR